jgi:hypothetical protein
VVRAGDRHTPLPWPAPESLLLKFVAHHLWDPVERETNADHGMPEDVAIALRLKGLLRSPGPHAPATVRRRLTSWSILTRWRGLSGSFSAPSLKSALRLAVRASNRPRQRKSKKAVTGKANLQARKFRSVDHVHPPSALRWRKVRPDRRESTDAGLKIG